ncbi:hypothetical protein LGH82_06625 [Mesorhizobium sp. PAMC28654]|uniref:RNA polymerase sigma factor region1.1 domain-containing protein n=1 Tax=Mesorhizobium sp. PAMC28654 TaxID=2880934 RepID=UPI001D09C7E5|nr:RNA polymerase sigma factor region1.1 domain-containing protein [Mesorhizobium sp. PAMC28654]UDL90955.1 hypothetical protein LGH82_06625 [Mesorhizobium sp. PAMC28654]
MSSDNNRPADIQPVVQALIEKGQDVTMSELDVLLPKRELNSAEIEDIFAALAEHGLHVTE